MKNIQGLETFFTHTANTIPILNFSINLMLAFILSTI